MSRPALSVAMIVKDEAANLPGCLASITPYADEVVVYDTGSTDETRDIARAAGCTVVEGYWDADFARARNAAAEHCSGDWLIQMDADERLIEFPDAVWDVLDSTKCRRFGVLEMHHAPYGMPSFVNTHYRMWRRGTASWVGWVHETLTRNGERPSFDADIVMLPIRVRHESYEDSEAMYRKAKRNVSIAYRALEAIDAGVDMPEGRRHYEFTRIACEELIAAGPNPTPAQVMHHNERVAVRTLETARRYRLRMPTSPKMRPYPVPGAPVEDPVDLARFYPDRPEAGPSREPQFVRDLVARNAPADVLESARYFVKLAGDWGVPVLSRPDHVPELRADLFGPDAEMINMRRRISNGLRVAAAWLTED